MMNWWHLGLRMELADRPAPLPREVFCRGAEMRGLPPAPPRDRGEEVEAGV
jgi:hypothetical protein